ncbi:hypothetical protein MAR_030338 [Mya arenaria]|uniref:Uncharacterized protein n=1 Tax=Mya arenaria TaxID=6604 RepID=A0ABY7DNK4_MYAAR|nr:uncharacterized protein LOC128222264 [Mya arenaria]WAQ97648.1 hypothetical protein MAR_030338 [Mya arenaria]
MLSRVCRSLFVLGSRDSSVIGKTLSTRNAASVSEVKEGHENVKKRKSKRKDKQSEHGDKPAYVLDFFNNCDYITLNRLSRSTFIKRSNIKNIILPSEMIKGDDDMKCRQRFVDINEFCDKSGFSKTQIDTLADLVMMFETQEKKQEKFARIFYPALEIPDTNTIETVVAVDIFLNDVIWSEQDVSSRLVTNLGHFFFDVKDNKRFDHVKHGQQMQKLCDQLPDCPMYFLNNRSGMFSRDTSGITQYQHLMESIFITHMNLRSNTDLGDSNNVILFTPNTLDAFYNLKFGQEVEMMFPLLKSWYKKFKSPIDGMLMSPKVEIKLFAKETDERVRERILRCILMSDAGCKILRRSEKKFPRFYSD